MTLKQSVQLGHSIGFSFTPLDGKIPQLKKWQKQPKESLETALGYANDGNVGLRCGSVSAPDGKYLTVIDQDDGGDVSGLNLPKTVTVKTASGYHYYFYSDKPIKNTASKLSKNVDTRGEGGQVVYPGSIHPVTGTLYEFLPGLSPSDIGVADLPEHIYKLLTTAKPAPTPRPKKTNDTVSMKYALAAVEYETRNVRNAAEGQRNDALNKAAFSLGTLISSGHLCADTASDNLLAAALDAGLTRSESINTIRSGIDSGKQHPRQIKKTTPTDATVKAAELRPLACTDLGNAERLDSRHGDDILFCFQTGKYMIWSGQNWQPNDSGEITRKTINTINHIWDEARAINIEESDDPESAEKIKDKLTNWALQSQSRGRIDAARDLIKSMRPVTVDQLDNDIYLFNCRNGTVDLRTGTLRQHNRNDRLTLVAPVEFYDDAECPLWLRFLDRIMDGNPDLIDFLQKLIGYSLSGDVNEQIFPILHGNGKNGKSVFIDTVMGLMGCYAAAAPNGLLIENNNSQHTTDIAMLQGKRLIHCSETEENRKLKVSLVKQLTGDKFLTARYMRQDNFQFACTHKIMMVTNHKPKITEDSEGIWRRVRLIPFEQFIPPEERDLKLVDKLKNEWPGILKWAVEGFKLWQSEGFHIPMEVVQATDEYRSDYDDIGDFIDDAIEEGVGNIPVTQVWSAYLKWCENRQIKYPIGRHTFVDRLRSRGFKQKNSRDMFDKKVKKCWCDINLSFDYQPR